MTTPIAVSLEMANELKAHGFPQDDSHFMWVIGGKIKGRGANAKAEDRLACRGFVRKDFHMPVAAPTAEEILRRFPMTVTIARSNRGSMRKAFHKLNGTHDKDDRFGAIVMPQETSYFLRPKGSKRRKWISDGSLGYALFTTAQLGSGLIAHESVHMARGFWQRANPKYLAIHNENHDADDEPLAYATGECARQITKALYRYHIW